MGEEKGEVKLLGSWLSPFAYIVKLALNLKGIQYENLEQDLLNKSQLLIETNPIHKKVPVLIHNGKPICESLIIIEYLDDMWKENPLLPSDPYKRAVARFWAKFVQEKLTEMVRKVVFFDGEEQENAVKQAKQALEILEGEISGKKLFGGETIGLVDIALGYIPVWLGAFEKASCVKIYDPAEYPNLTQWIKNFMELQLVKDSNVPEEEKLAVYFGKIRQYTLAKNAGK